MTFTLSCFACGTGHDPDALQTVCVACSLPIRVDFALDRKTMPRAALAGRPASMWRYREVLPGSAHPTTLVEGSTPLIDVGDNVLVKDESRNPTGSFKARGLSAAVTMARHLGARTLSAPSAGNAAGALAAYGARAGLRIVVAMPDDTPEPFVAECRHYGAEVHLVPGTIADAGRWLREHGPREAFDVSTLREPYRIEGKKTLLYELVETLGALPDVIVYPTGGGTGLVGMWKAISELKALGWVAADARPPRFVSVQAAGCAPIVRGFVEGAETTYPWADAETRAYGLRVPSPIGGFLCLRALRETGGTAVAVDEADIEPAAAALAARTGIDICPEGGAAWAAYTMLSDKGWVRPDERVVVFNTGTGLKYR